jgi:hypothetical protein
MGDSKPRRFQFSLRALLVLVAICALLLGTGRLLYDYRIGSSKDSYTGLQLAAMVNAYLDAHECAWPRDWEDLREFSQVYRRADGSSYYTFAEVQDCWDIDFQANPVELAATKLTLGQPPFHAIYQRHRRPLAFPEWEPNLRVYWRLRRQAGAQVAAMVIQYMKANNGAWPKNWDQLHDIYPTALNEEGRHYCSFQQAKACVAVDFDADPQELARAKPPSGKRPFRVIYLRHGRTDEGPWDPNQRVFQYLTGSLQKPGSDHGGQR